MNDSQIIDTYNLLFYYGEPYPPRLTIEEIANNLKEIKKADTIKRITGAGYLDPVKRQLIDDLTPHAEKAAERHKYGIYRTNKNFYDISIFQNDDFMQKILKKACREDAKNPEQGTRQGNPIFLDIVTKSSTRIYLYAYYDIIYAISENRRTIDKVIYQIKGVTIIYYKLDQYGRAIEEQHRTDYSPTNCTGPQVIYS